MGFAEKINSMPKYVVSRTLTDQAASWNPTTVVRDDVPDTLRALKAQPGGDLLMYGSATLMRSLAEHDLIDEYNLLLNPVVVGSGKLLHPAGSFPHKLTLAEATAFRGGIVGLRYQPAGDSGAAPVNA
jgi:dihydrofolate reductase